MRNKVASLMVRSKPNRETEKWRAHTFKSKGDNKSVQGDRAILYPAVSFPKRDEVQTASSDGQGTVRNVCYIE
jgi:hypothetical protein